MTAAAWKTGMHQRHGSGGGRNALASLSGMQRRTLSGSNAATESEGGGEKGAGNGADSAAATHCNRFDLAEAVSDSIFEAAGGEALLGSLNAKDRITHLVTQHNWHPMVALKVSESFGTAEQARVALRGVWEEGASPGASSLLALYDDALRKFKHNGFLGYWIMDTLYPLGAWKTISYFQLSLLIADIRQLLSDLGVTQVSFAYILGLF